MKPLSSTYLHYRNTNVSAVQSFVSRFQQCLTLDIILSTAFGVQSNCQSDPNDPLMAKAREAMTPSFSRKVVFMLSSVLPFGNKILKQLSGWLFGSFDNIGKVAEEMIALRREESSNRRMVLIKFVRNECFVLSVATGEQEKEIKRKGRRRRERGKK